MTNHTHLIVVPSDARLLARAIGEAHRRYTRMKNFSAGVRGYLFQGRFGSETFWDWCAIGATISTTNR
jgi:putative transposase